MNVLVVPWGMAQSGHLDAIVLAIALLFAKAVTVGVAVVVIESSFAKLRLYKIPEFTVASFMLAVLAVVIFLFEPAYGDQHLTVFGAVATITAVVVLLLEFGMVRSQEVWEQLRLYALGSGFVAILAIATAATCHGSDELYMLDAVTPPLKSLLFPLGIRYVLRRLDADVRVPSSIGVASGILLAIVLSALTFVVLRPLLLFDVLVGVLVFVVLVQYLAVERTAVRTDELTRLTG
jgi:hypothetical protein